MSTYVARMRSPLASLESHVRSCISRPQVRRGARVLSCAFFDSRGEEKTSAPYPADQLDRPRIRECCGSAAAGYITGVDVCSGHAAAGGGVDT